MIYFFPPRSGCNVGALNYLGYLSLFRLQAVLELIDAILASESRVFE